MEKLVAQAEGEVAQIAAIFTEGDDDWSRVVALGNFFQELTHRKHIWTKSTVAPDS